MLGGGGVGAYLRRWALINFLGFQGGPVNRINTVFHERALDER